MPRYIDADVEVSKYVTVWDCNCSEFGKQTVMAVDDLHYLPTADVAPRAEWIKDNTSKFEHRYNCSVCDFRHVGKPTPYCPNCGSKMKGGE